MNEDLIDQPTTLRRGEEIDTESLESYLKRHLEPFSGISEVQQFPSGYSNLTYLVTGRDGSQHVLRRPPFGAKIKSAHDMAREFKILDTLKGIYNNIPTAVLLCNDESVIGAPFYLMERVQGVVLRRDPPPNLNLSADQMRSLSAAFVDNLCDIHSVDWQSTNLKDLAHPEGYIQRQVAGWSKRYMNAKTDEITEMDFLMLWLEEHRPPESSSALIHNDYKYDNLVLDPEDLSRINAVLDWEMATIGDPLMDLGTTLAYWVEENDPEELQALRFCPTQLAGNLPRKGLLERYLSQSEIQPPADILFYYTYGIFKLAVIVQQIYARHAAGKTQDPRFAGLNKSVKALAIAGYRAIQRDTI